MKKHVNNDIRNINKHFEKAQELEENLKYEIAKETHKNINKQNKDKK